MKKQISIVLLLIATTFAFSQDVNVLQGKWKDLKDITKYKLVFEYSNLSIPKYDNEAAFLKDKMKKREDKEAGAGEIFKKSWFADRENRYEPKFIESFNKRWKNNKVEVNKDLDEAEYTIKVHTTLMFAGYNVGVFRQNARINAILYIYKNDVQDAVLFSVSYSSVVGSGAFGYDYNSGYRISESYAKLAKTFAANLKKKAK